MTVGLAIGGVLWLAMVGVSCYGWRTLPTDAPVPVHFGPTAYNVYVPKRLGLLIHPAAGAVLYVVVGVTRLSAHAPGGPRAPGAVVLPLIMCVLLVVQAGAIRVARRRSSF